MKRPTDKSPHYTNPIIIAWRHFGCNLDPDMFNNMFYCIWQTWRIRKISRKFEKTLTPDQLEYLDRRIEAREINLRNA